MESDFTNNVVRCNIHYTGRHVRTSKCKLAQWVKIYNATEPLKEHGVVKNFFLMDGSKKKKRLQGAFRHTCYLCKKKKNANYSFVCIFTILICGALEEEVYCNLCCQRQSSAPKGTLGKKIWKGHTFVRSGPQDQSTLYEEKVSQGCVILSDVSHLCWSHV